MLKNMDPPLGFGSKCPDRLAYKKLIRMNMPLDNEGKVHFTTTLFALIRENLSIKMRAAEEMDQADVELRETILKVWPFTAKEKIELLVPTTRGNWSHHCCVVVVHSVRNGFFCSRHWPREANCWQDLWRSSHPGKLEVNKVWKCSNAKGKQNEFLFLVTVECTKSLHN